MRRASIRALPRGMRGSTRAPSAARRTPSSTSSSRGAVRSARRCSAANFPRAYLDVNREPYELDPRMFDGRLPAFANTRSMRVAGGLGTIPRIVGDGQEIYAGRLPVDEGLARIETLYKPYHAGLAALLQRTQERFGSAVLIDCHSMPSSVRGAGRRGRRPTSSSAIASAPAPPA